MLIMLNNISIIGHLSDTDVRLHKVFIDQKKGFDGFHGMEFV